MGYLFVFYMFFMFFSVLNIVTGVFVDGAIQLGNSDRAARLAKESANRREFLGDMLEMLLALDQDGSGVITYDEWTSCIQDPSVNRNLTMLDIRTDDYEM